MLKTIPLWPILLAFLTASQAMAAHPLITDDAGTQGMGNFQLELNSEYSHEDENGATENAFELSTVLSYGIADTLDLVLGVPYQHIRLKDAGTKETESGLSDISLELKWRFYEKDGLSLGLKPGVTLPTGDDDRGLGAGKPTYSLFLIGSKEADPWQFHANLGYIRNENKSGERRNLWHASLAAMVEAAKDLLVVANIGIERNTDRNVNTHPAFALAGLIYSFSENFDVDLGVKVGLSNPETDYSLLAGLAWRF